MKVHLAAVALFLGMCSVQGAIAQQPAKSMRATGRVVSLSTDSITIKPGAETLTLTVDSSTRVTGKGVGTKIRALKSENKSPQITDLIGPNDSVVVEYRDSGNNVLKATRVDVRVKAFKKE